ncbi:XRE family transcriptional regulator [Pseudomonas sp. W2-17]|uniref:XRE family transcriptional regulator n=1 Tax=Pseudomonas sp. W2-17 TaxID=3058039 RepID=UPI0034E07560
MKITDRILKVMSEAGCPPRQIKPSLAIICGVSYQAVNQWFSGEVANIRIEHLIEISKHLNVSLDWLVTGESAEPRKLDPIELLGDEYVLIHQYSVTDYLSRGPSGPHLALEGGLAFKKSWLEAMQVDPSGVLSHGCEDQGMEPYIFKGDTLLIDVTDTSPKSGLVYALRGPEAEDVVRVRRLFRGYSGVWVVKADSDDKRLYPDETIPDEQFDDLGLVVGRVIWRGGATS